MATFTMVGKLSAVRDSERLKYYEEKDFGTWEQRTLTLNMKADTNSFILKARGGKMNKIYAYNSMEKDRMEIDWADRKKASILNKIAIFNKYIIDLSNRELLKALDSFKRNGKIDSRFKDLIENKSETEIDDLIEQEKKKRKEFLAVWDFAEYIKEIIDSGEFADSNFYVTGNISFNYNQKNNRWYQSYDISRIYLADKEAKAYSKASVELFYDADSLDESTIDDGIYTIRGAVSQYDWGLKETVYAPYEVVIKAAKEDDELGKKKTQLQISRFKNIKKDEVFMLGMELDLLNGSQRIEITEDDLTEEQQDSLLFGEITWDDIYAELGTTTWGERVTMNVFVKPARGYTSGRKDTDLTPDMLDISFFLDRKEEVSDVSFDEDSSDDLFDDDDDLFA